MHHIRGNCNSGRNSQLISTTKVRVSGFTDQRETVRGRGYSSSAQSRLGFRVQGSEGDSQRQG